MSEPGGIPQAGWLGIVAAIVALIGGPKAIGAAATWLADRAEKRRVSRAEGNAEWEGKLKGWDAELAERERALAQRLSDGLAECERHCEEIGRQMEAVRRDNDALREDNRVAILAVTIAVPRLAEALPASPELNVIRTLLASRFKVDLNTPQAMTDLLALLDHKTA